MAFGLDPSDYDALIYAFDDLPLVFSYMLFTDLVGVTPGIRPYARCQT